MYIKINRKLFIDRLRKCNAVIDPKSLIVYLTNIELKVKPDSLTMIAVNNNKYSYKTTIKKSEDLVINTPGSALINGKQLSNIIEKMDSDLIEISLIENNIIFINDEKSEFSISTIDHEISHTKKFNETGEYIEISNEELKKGISNTLPIISEFCPKSFLRGLNFSYSENEFRFLASDNSRIAIKKIEVLSCNIDELDATIPKQTLIELEKLIPDTAECKIIKSMSTVTFVFDNSTFECNILESNFPNMSRFYNLESLTKLTFDYKSFLNVIWRAVISNDDKNYNDVKFDCGDSEIHINTSSADCTFKEIINEFQIEGEPFQTITFNPKFVYDALKTFNVRRINFNVSGYDKPIIISADEDKSLTHIVMPLWS